MIVVPDAGPLIYLSGALYAFVVKPRMTAAQRRRSLSRLPVGRAHT